MVVNGGQRGISFQQTRQRVGTSVGKLWRERGSVAGDVIVLLNRGVEHFSE